MCAYINKYSSQYTAAGRMNERNRIRTAVKGMCQGNLSAYHFGHVCHGFDSRGLAIPAIIA